MQLTRDGKNMVYTMQSGSQPVEIYRGASSGGAGGGAHASQRRGAELAISSRRSRISGWRRGEGAGAELRREAARISMRKQKYPVADADSRRSAGRLGAGLDLSLERAGVRRRRLRGGDAESARLDRLRPEVHRRDQRRLGRPRLRRHHGRRRPRGDRSLRRHRRTWPRPALPTAAT